MKTFPLLVALLLAASVCVCAGPPAADERLFPFVLPWDDSSPGVTDCSALLDAPAGTHGHVRAGDDGHFYAGEKRIRFLGVNVTNSAGLPTHDEAEKIAARLAKFGINVVRFHFLDAGTWPRSLWRRDVRGEFEPEALDRLGYFIAQLKARGIYSNINLLVGRRFTAEDGLPAEIARLDWKESHIPGFFSPAHLAVQKDYARRLLTHRNPHTGLTFAEDPAVAFVEINNENGLIHSWLGGDVDALPEVFCEELRTRWVAWLRARHGSTEKLRAAWSAGAQPAGAELLSNASFTAQLRDWVLEQHAGAAAEVVVFDAGDGVNGVRISVKKPGAESWHVQFNQRALKLAAGQPFTVEFRARAAAPMTARVNVAQAHEPWRDLGLSAALPLTTQWQPFRFVFNSPQADENARLSFSALGGDRTVVELAGLSLRPGGVSGLKDDERLEAGSIPAFRRTRIGERTPAAQDDWMAFLWETEDAYWQAMRGFLKDELHVKGLVTGTVVGCAPPNMMARMEWVDTHAYWQHPRWPGRPWDPANWHVDNRTMVNERGGTLPPLALRRVLGKPHAVTEYNHPAPNTYSGEGFLLLAAYAALQDWDAIYAYTYAHGRAEGWEARRIVSYFDIDQHPVKMATLPAVASIFLRGDVRPAEKLLCVPLDRDGEMEHLRSARPWSLVDASHAGVPPESALIHRVALAAGGRKVPADAIGAEKSREADTRFVSDTAELTWDLAEVRRGVVTIHAPRTRAVIGFGGGKKFTLGDVVIEPGEGTQNSWSALVLTARDVAAKRWLLTAVGSAENTGMAWKNAEKSTVGRDWGGAPSCVEGVPARIVFANARGIEVWALDERGQRRERVPAEAGSAGAGFRIGPETRTLWFEVTAQ